MDFANYLNISALNSHIRPLLGHLLNNNIGAIEHDELFGDGGLRIYEFATGRPCIDYCSSLSSGMKDVGDRFKLKISYAGKPLIWDVVFNSLSPEEPPDFDFNDEHFTRTIDANCLEKFVPSLLNWKFDDPASLKNVMSEFLSFYKKFQIELLKEDNCGWFEYVSIMKSGLISENDIEVLVTNTGAIHFLIHLTLDVTDYKLPHPSDHYGAYFAVCINANSGNKMPKTQIKMTAPLKECIVPPVSSASDNIDTVSKYLAKMKERFEESISPVYLKPIAKRKRFIFEFLSSFGRKVIEFDAIKFRSVSLLIENEDSFAYIISIHLPKDFTASAPEYKFQSVYSPLVIPIDSVPYNPNWLFRNMMMKASTFIETKVPMFRKNCVQHLS